MALEKLTMLAVSWAAGLAHFFAPWQHVYSDSKTLATMVTAVHLLALLFGGGLAIAADRTTLWTANADAGTRHRLLEELHVVHRPVLVALALLFVSGFAFAAADVETFAASPAFAVKLVLVGLLLVNGGVLARTEVALRGVPRDAETEFRLWRRLRVTAWCSLTLWAATVLAGTVLLNAA